MKNINGGKSSDIPLSTLNMHPDRKWCPIWLLWQLTAVYKFRWPERCLNPEISLCSAGRCLCLYSPRRIDDALQGGNNWFRSFKNHK